MSNLVYEEKRRSQGRQLMAFGSLVFLTSAVLSSLLPNQITTTVSVILMILSLGLLFFGCGLHLYAYCFCCGPPEDPEGNSLYHISDEPVKISPMRQQWLGLVPVPDGQQDSQLIVTVSRVTLERRISRDISCSGLQDEQATERLCNSNSDLPPPYAGLNKDG